MDYLYMIVPIYNSICFNSPPLNLISLLCKNVQSHNLKSICIKDLLGLMMGYNIKNARLTCYCCVHG
jgi:hypothetical protein